MGVAESVSGLHHLQPRRDGLQPDGSPIDERKLVFLSSPNKGLKFTLDAFRASRRARCPTCASIVGNPGYKTGQAARLEGVEYLGPQPQQRIHAEVRTALCTFFPNFVIPETFGLVFAESQALGTPVLTHDCGAAREVLGDPAQILPVTAAKRVYEALLGGCPSRLAPLARPHGGRTRPLRRLRRARPGLASGGADR